MARPAPSACLQRNLTACRRQAFTLVEVLTATALTLLLMVAVVQIFATVSGSISESRAALEMNDRLRTCAMRLQRDLMGVTVPMIPPRRPQDNEGYFEYVEGPMVNGWQGLSSLNTSENYRMTAVDTLSSSNVDTTVGDVDDILMFTTRDESQPFVGKYNTGATGSSVAEVAWFVRGHTLYRRVLLVLPTLTANLTSNSTFYQNFDLSVRPDPNNPSGNVKFNSLGDLANRENRFGHPSLAAGGTFPFSTRGWKQLGLPILWESGGFTPGQSPTSPSTMGSVDFWTPDASKRPPAPYSTLATDDPYVPTLPRANEDVILTNVIAFDVKAWDPGAPLRRATIGSGNLTVAPGDIGYANATVVNNLYGAYVNLGYDPGLSYTQDINTNQGYPSPCFHRSNFDHLGALSRLYRTYDTWSTHYECDGIDQNSNNLVDEGTDGFDNNGDGMVDDLREHETGPPYPFPLRGIQVKIRTFDPDSRQIRETTVVQDFLID